jgi:pimeloyl-ACP methyl ester carboxylesterase
MPQEQVFNANGVQINFVQASSAGHPLVLFHGIASQWQSFLPLLPELTKEYRVYALDLRGHGGSSWVNDEYRLLDYVQDIHCFLDSQVKQPAIVYGHSFGALIAIAVAAQAPTDILGVILGEPPLFYSGMTLKESIWYEPFSELHHLLSSMRSAREIDAYMAKRHPNMDQEQRQSRAACLSRVDPAVVGTILSHRHMEGYDVDALLQQISCPVLLMQGNSSLGAAVRDEDVAYAVEQLRRCDVMYMHDIGHGLPSGDLLDKVCDFMKSV